MALELNGKPYKMSREDIELYSRRYIFRVGRQYMKVNNDPDLPRVEVSPVHINTRYRHYKKNGTIKEPLGELIFFSSKVYNQDSKTDEYTPARIEVGYQGYLTVDDPELAYFLDNHPSNEVVKADSTHPNFNTAVSTYFATYNADKVRTNMVDNIRLASELSLDVLNNKKYSNSKIQALAFVVTDHATDYNIAHRLVGLTEMDPKDIRAEIARLCSDYPHAMDELINNKSIDYVEACQKFKEMGLVKFDGNEWGIVEPGKPVAALMRVSQGHDAIKALADWFANSDKRGTRFKQLQAAYSTIEKQLQEE